MSKTSFTVFNPETKKSVIFDLVFNFSGEELPTRDSPYVPAEAEIYSVMLGDDELINIIDIDLLCKMSEALADGKDSCHWNSP